MSAIGFNTIAVVGYLIAAAYALRLIIQKHSLKQLALIILIIVAIIAQAFGLYLSITSSDLNSNLNLSIHNMASLVVLLINSLVILSSLQKPLHNLFLFLLPISIVTVASSILFAQSGQHLVAVTPGVGSHIILSIVAYSILAIATLQALLWSWQNHHIKHHHLTRITNLLPPLQTMEQLMFEILGAGVILLVAAIGLGFVFIDNIFDQHLVHKTVLSLFALAIFAALLWGRYRLGWRGNTAVRWILSGFCLLMLGYFGSKVVLELILNNQ